MENLEPIQTIISAFIGLGSAIIVAILTGIIQLCIAKKDRKIAEKQFEQSKLDFSARMQQSQKEYVEKLEQIKEEQKRANIAKANDILQARSNRFYNDLIEETLFYDRLENELYYLNKVAHPENKEFRLKGVYPYVDNNVKDIIRDIALHPHLSNLLGDLRANISLYNAALEQGADSEILEESLKRIYDLIQPINTEMFEDSVNTQTSLRELEIERAKQIVQEN